MGTLIICITAMVSQVDSYTDVKMRQTVHFKYGLNCRSITPPQKLLNKWDLPLVRKLRAFTEQYCPGTSFHVSAYKECSSLQSCTAPIILLHLDMFSPSCRGGHPGCFSLFFILWKTWHTYRKISKGQIPQSAIVRNLVDDTKPSSKGDVPTLCS